MLLQESPVIFFLFPFYTRNLQQKKESLSLKATATVFP